jgi:hypothetical protein
MTRPQISLRLRLATLAIATIVSAACRHLAAEEVTVGLRSGRSFTGIIDDRTSGEQLVLRFEGSASRVWRPIAWNEIAAARSGDRRLSLAELKQLAAASRSSAEPLEPPVLTDDRSGISYVDLRAATPRVASLRIDATLANWDADVEPDGVIIEAFPFDADGAPVAVDGTLQVELIAARPIALTGIYVRTRGEPFRQLAYMNFALRRSAMPYGSARLKLAFQADHPDLDLSLSTFGFAHARLAVPGQGIFEASVDLVNIRPYSPTRDALQMIDGVRYFPQEFTTDRPR